GKRDTDLILPINSSLSVTLHQDQVGQGQDQDQVRLNGRGVDGGPPRIQACLREVRRLARKRRGGSEDTAALSLSYKIHIASENNFPTAAGLASSAAGYACLGVSPCCDLCPACGCVMGTGRGVTGVSRSSDVRPAYGSVAWRVLGEGDGGGWGVPSVCAPAGPALWRGRVPLSVSHQVSGEKKPMGSTVGMQTSVETSPLLKHRAEVVVPERLAQMMRHIRERDFEGFGQLAMRDSNQFHATCLDTFPPIFYLTDLSRHIIALAHRYNAHHGHTKVAYTFDAGPNAVIFAL
ncbi:Diphosphomevalonate decarboxylase, partial [Corvus brachyrhynchos]